VTAEPSRPSEHRIVVGVDGSESSQQALAWAVRQGRLTGAVVQAVTAWELPYGTRFPVLMADVDFEQLAVKTVTDAIAKVSADADAVTIRYKVAEGNAAQVLVDASAGADLVVVGSRGHGGFVEALLGSIGQHCVHHANCPVVVIRGSAAGPH
jgi:nucleotide-binding universal stress UspA family protein